jgi:tetratricopeptide (TPR) repeat protein
MLTTGQTDRALVAPNQAVGKNTSYDVLARMLRARALLAKKDTSGALADLNIALGARPNDPGALLLRSLVWLDMRDFSKALDDLNKAIAERETVENYYVRAKVYEAQNKFDKATDDYRRSTQLPPATVFDVAAQTEARQKVQQLSKKVPCGSSTGTGTCL